MSSKKLPSMQWYPGDWRKDPGVQSLTLAERGAWWEILQLTWESPVRGLLLLPSGKPMPIDRLARVLGADRDTVEEIVQTLEDCGVADRHKETGALMNRRQYREDAVRRKRAEAGRKGGQKTPDPETSKTEAKPQAKRKQKPSKNRDVEKSKTYSATTDSEYDAQGAEEANDKQTPSPSRTRAFSSSSASTSVATSTGERARESGPDIDEHAEAMLEDLNAHLETLDGMEAQKLEAQAVMVAKGEDPKAWETDDGTKVPPPERPALFRMALGFHADGTQRAFRSSVRYAVKIYTADDPTPVDPTMSAADRRLIESVNSLRDVDLGAAIQ